MSLITKLFIEDQEINVFDLNFRFERAVDATGMPMGKPHGTVFKLIFETTRERHDLFMQWATDTHMMKNAKIVISPITGTSKSRVMELIDVCCIHHQIYFNNGQTSSFDKNLLSPRMQKLLARGEKTSHLMEVHLTPAIFINDGVKILEHYWKKTDLNAKEIQPTIVNTDKDIEILSLHFEDENGVKITEIEEGKVFLIIKTKNGLGKNIDIDLANDLHSFKYRGNVLENEVLQNIQLTQDTLSIELEVFLDEVMS